MVMERIARHVSPSVPAAISDTRLKVNPEVIQVVKTGDRLFHNPRLSFKPEPLANLKKSIRDLGLLKPLAVKTLDNGRFELVAGERRLRCILELTKTNEPVFDRLTKALRPAREVYAYVPVEVVSPADDLEQLQIAIAENMEHSPVADWDYFVLAQDLCTKYDRDRVCKIFNKSAPWLSHTLSLARLPEQVQDLMKAGRLSRTAAIQLLSARPEQIDTVLRRSEEIVIQDCEAVVAEARETLRAETIATDAAETDAAVAREMGDMEYAKTAEQRAATSRRKMSVAHLKLDNATKKRRELGADAINQALAETDSYKEGVKRKVRSPKQAKQVTVGLRQLLDRHRGQDTVFDDQTQQAVSYADLEAFVSGIEWVLGNVEGDPLDALARLRPALRLAA